jgi:hypothetical protein
LVVVFAVAVGMALFVASEETSCAATVFNVSFSSALVGGIAVSATDLQATVSGSSSPYTVTTLTGDIDVGGTDYAVSIIAPGGFALNDNLLNYPTTPYLDFSGISFSAGGNQFDIYNDGFDDIVSNIGSGDVDDLSVIEAAPAPLPPTWTMMLGGIAVIGLMAYRRKSKSALMAA